MDHFKMEWRMDGKTNEEKKSADDAFKKQFKQFCEHMKQHGFYSRNTSSIMRVTDLDVIEYIDLQKDMHGRKYFTINFAILPLCDRFQTAMNISYGRRIGALYSDYDQWFGYIDDIEAKNSFDFVTQKIEQYVLPWFKSLDNKKKLLEYVISRTSGLNNMHPLLLSRNLAMKFGETAIAKRCDTLYEEQLPAKVDTENMPTRFNLDKKKKEHMEWRNAVVENYYTEKEHINQVEPKVYIREQECNSAKMCRIPKFYMKRYSETEEL